MYIIYWIYSTDKIARHEGSSLGEQIMYILVGLGIIFIIKKKL